MSLKLRQSNRRVRETPTLDILGPLLAGTAAVLLGFGACFGAAAYARIDTGVALAGARMIDDEVTIISHPRGVVGAVHVIEGQHVGAGDPLVSFETGSIDEEIGALKAKLEASARQLENARLEASTMADLVGRKLAGPSEVEALQRKVAEIEREAAGLTLRIRSAEALLEQSVLRAAVPGRVRSITPIARGSSVTPGAVLLEIASDNARVLVEGRLAGRIPPVGLFSGCPAVLWPQGREDGGRLASLTGKVVRVAAATGSLNGAPELSVRIELDSSRADLVKRLDEPLLSRMDGFVQTGTTTVLDRLSGAVADRASELFEN
jgi:multidrug efflux pump subunit AcrA (membrane-fusion protein)